MTTYYLVNGYRLPFPFLTRAAAERHNDHIGGGYTVIEHVERPQPADEDRELDTAMAEAEGRRPDGGRAGRRGHREVSERFIGRSYRGRGASMTRAYLAPYNVDCETYYWVLLCGSGEPRERDFIEEVESDINDCWHKLGLYDKRGHDYFGNSFTLVESDASYEQMIEDKEANDYADYLRRQMEER